MKSILLHSIVLVHVVIHVFFFKNASLISAVKWLKYKFLKYNTLKTAFLKFNQNTYCDEILIKKIIVFPCHLF